MCAAVARNQRVQSKHARVRRTSERKWGKRVVSPAQATHNVTGVAFHCNKGRIKRCAAYRIKYNVETFAACHLRHIFIYGTSTISMGMTSKPSTICFFSAETVAKTLAP